MSATDRTRELRSLLFRLRKRLKPLGSGHAGTPPEGTDPVVHELVYSFLAWEASAPLATGALNRMQGAVVDYNELRVCYPQELASLMGEGYPLALERATRLRAALTEVYRREHGIALARLVDLPKRDARVYLETLEGVPPFVAARVVLLALGGHAVPLDSVLHGLLAAEEAVEPGSTVADAMGWLERTLRAKESEEAYLLLEAWRKRKAPKIGTAEGAKAKRTGKARG
ncbi:MAG: hypothetical protein AMXMBFR77_05870 [Phycisphaerales bacterium]|nr:hypothetical protein [Phycisphaerales bacterium]GIK19869.1 MAG: hypothetical protein BroJett004_20330 [Planctomycetota bacterium]